MARRTTFVKLLDQLRAEARMSLNPAHSTQVRDSHVNLIQRIQERLWDDFTWPHLRVERSVPVQIGQRFYDPPADMQLDNIERLEIYDGGNWRQLRAGVGGAEYTIYNSDLNERAYPPRRWKIHEDNDIELWPISDQNGDPATLEGFIKFTGIRNLNPLVADTDRADLDDRMIVLYGAAEILAASGAKDAKLKLDMADRIYTRLRSGLTPRRRFKMFGIGEPEPFNRMFVTRYRPPV